MDEDEGITARQQALFAGNEQDDNPEEWACQKVKSPGGTWYIIKNENDRDIYEKQTTSGRRRAVVSRNELFNFQQTVKEMEKPDRQQWLSTMIDIKTAIPGTRIESVRVHQKSKPSPSFEHDPEN